MVILKVRKIYAILLFLAATVPLHIAHAERIKVEEVDFASDDDRKKFDSLPSQIKDLILDKRPGIPPTPEIIAKNKSHTLQFIVRNHQIEPKSKEWEFLKNRIMEESPVINSAPEPGTKAPLEHFRFKGGADRPSNQAIKENHDLILARANTNAEAMMTKINLKVNLEDPVPAIANSPKLISKPKCENSAVATLDIPEGYLAEGQAMDLLFFDGIPPFDIQSTIGATTVLVPFGNKENAEFASAFDSLGIECLPYRLRSTGKKVYYGKGALALKNYDANPEADGTFDPTVRKYIEESGLGGIN